MADAPSSAVERVDMRALVERYAEDLAALNRYYDIPLAAEDLEEKRRFLLAQRQSLRGLDFEALGQDDRIDYLLLENHVEHELTSLSRQEQRNGEVCGHLPFWGTVARLERERRQVARVDPRGVASALTELVREAEQARQRTQDELAAGDAPAAAGAQRVVARRVVRGADRLRTVLKRWYDFYDGYDPGFTWWAGPPYQDADKALESYVAFLREKLLGVEEDSPDGPIVGDPVGREALEAELAHAMIPYTPEELVAIGQREFAWCETEMARASRELGYGDEWHKALEHVKSGYVTPGEQPRLIRELAIEAIEFLEQRDLVTVPPLARRLWRVEMMSPERQKVNPFFTGGETIHVSFPTSTMGYHEKLMSLRANNVHFARATVHHELIPGHHLQGFMARRHRPYRRLFATPFFSEGWAVHWEMLLWDLGFPQSAEDRIGMLFWRMHRCARVVFSLRFHLGGMTPQECVDYLVSRVGFEPASAAAEVRRSFEEDYPPLYQCAYLIGALQVRALHGELVGSGPMTDREFHDALLRENAIPVELLRTRLKGEALNADFSPSWRFAGEDLNAG